MKEQVIKAIQDFENFKKYSTQKLTDSHCHVLDEMYTQTQQELIDEWFNNNGGDMFLIGVDANSSEQMVQNTKINSSVHAIIGIHPEYAKKISQTDIDVIEKLAPSACGIGEIGLDFYYGKDDEQEQIALFEKQLLIAEKYNLPVCIHTRDAMQKTFDMLKAHPKIKGVIHCYGGSKEMAKEFVKMGYKIGVGGIITFKNNRQLVESVLEVGIGNIVLETDSPYLTPEPFRGQVNKPMFVYCVARKVADLLNLTVEEVLTQTSKNALEVYNINK